MVRKRETHTRAGSKQFGVAYEKTETETEIAPEIVTEAMKALTGAAGGLAANADKLAKHAPLAALVGAGFLYVKNESDKIYGPGSVSQNSHFKTSLFSFYELLTEFRWGHHFDGNLDQKYIRVKDALFEDGSTKKSHRFSGDEVSTIFRLDGDRFTFKLIDNQEVECSIADSTLTVVEGGDWLGIKGSRRFRIPVSKINEIDSYDVVVGRRSELEKPTQTNGAGASSYRSEQTRLTD